MSRWWLDALSPTGRGRAVDLVITDTQTATLERELDALQLRRGTRLTCILAGEGVRYRIVPWSDELSRASQRQLLAEQCFCEAYGEVARTWTVRQHAVRHGAATLACAIDTPLLDRLDALTRARRLKLVSVQPSLMHAYNRVRRSIGSGLHWFVAVESGWNTLLLMSPTEPLQVKRQPSSGADLAHLLDREWFALGIDAPRCPVYISIPMPTAVSDQALRSSSGGWRFINLDATDPVVSSRPVAPASTALVHP